MLHSAEMLRCLRACDVAGVRKLWAHVSPHLPQPGNDYEALASIHAARTQMEAMGFEQRAYSHAWLTERGLPSWLPDELKPRAQRLYPRIVEAVGTAVQAAPGLQDLGSAMRVAMREAVLECYAHKKTNPDFVRARIRAAQIKVLKAD